MAKHKSKKKSKRRGKGGGGNNGSAGAGIALAAVGNVVGNMLGQLLADGLGSVAAKKATAAGADDVAAQILKCLAERGPQSIPDLIESTQAGLTPVLHALQTIKDFRLVDFVGEGDLVQLTASGSRTVTVVQKHDIKEQAARMLEG